MICIQFSGGLGNQFFQYAIGRSLALRHQTELIFDTSILSSKCRGITPRNFDLVHFKIKGRLASAYEMAFIKKERHLRFLPLVEKKWVFCSEKGRNFNPNFINYPNQSYLSGYWQSHKYFSAISDVLLTELVPVEEISTKAKNLQKLIFSENSVAIHIRRGDYVTLESASNYHGLLDISYFSQAIDIARNNLKKPVFYIFSDEIEWCSSQKIFTAADIIISDNNMIEDFLLMSDCKHHIISNSSYSWWAAWLGDHKSELDDRLVIGPKNWFKKCNELDIKSRMPDHWIKL